jgi:serine protease Do
MIYKLKQTLNLFLEETMKRKLFTLTTLIVIALFSLTACSGLTAALPSQQQLQPPAGQQQSSPSNSASVPTLVPPSNSASPDASALAGYEGTLENIYTTVNPEVVNIHVVEKQASSTNSSQQIFPFNLPGLPNNAPQSQQPQYSEALGSGFIWDNQGDIVTNNHVVDGANQIEVTFSDGTTVPAKLVGADPSSDLAVVKVDTSADKLHKVSLADSSQIKVGQLAVAIGNPFGLQGTMTVGIISAVGRSLPADLQTSNGATYSIPDVIQTDAPINPGNSGGVLVDDQGHVVGVTSAIQSPVQANAGVGFAIPSTIVDHVVPALISTGHYDHPYLGISGTTLTPEIAKAMKLNAAQQGALVIEVTPNGPADKAGLQGSNQQATIFGSQTPVGGDVITAVDGQPVKSMDDLIAYLFDSTSVGQKITLTLLRNGNQMTADVTLETRPSEQQSGQQTATNSSQAWLGITGVPMTSDIAKAMNLPSDTQGVLVERVQSGGPADKAGLQSSYKPALIGGQLVLIGGDVIVGLDNQPITSNKDLSSALGQYSPGQQVTLTLLRKGQQTEAQVTLGAQPSQ